MDKNAKRFARRILLIHGLLLIVVLATVAAAAREIYTTTRQQLVKEAEQRQQQLTKQTASGIASHYQSILNDLDLLRRVENDETGAAKPATQAVEELQPLNPSATAEGPPDRFDNRPDNRPDLRLNGRPLIRQTPQSATSVLMGAVSSLFSRFGSSSQTATIMWRQVSGRVSLLFTINRNAPAARGGAQEVVIGQNDDRLVVGDIAGRSREWIEQQKSPSFGRFDTVNGVGFNLVCIPTSRGRLVGVIPIRGIEKEFLQPLNADDATGAWLIDEAGTAMAASRPELVGTSATAISDPELHVLAGKYIQAHAAGTEVVPRQFKIGAATFAPAIISAQPVTIGNKKWELFVTTSLDEVDGLAGRLFHRALMWCVFVVMSFTAILVSTSIQMIRARLRMERVRHDLLTRELSQAREIQLAWLPDQQPANASVDVAAINHPASHISGDFYNWFELPDGRVVVIVGDVTGHGMAAAFLMATTQLLVRNTMVRLGDPGRCLEEVNRQLCVQVFNGQFVTMIVMILDTKLGRMQVATAGHPSPLLADGESFQPLTIEPQLVLGVDRDTKYVTEQFDLPAQASLLLYTDGVVECPDSTYARFGDERLRRCLYGRYDTAQSMLDQITTAVNGFRGSRHLDDDLTLVAVQLQPIASKKHGVPAAAV